MDNLEIRSLNRSPLEAFEGRRVWREAHCKSPRYLVSSSLVNVDTLEAFVQDEIKMRFHCERKGDKIGIDDVEARVFKIVEW